MIVTLSERTEEATKRRRDAIRTVCGRLTRFARRYKGRYSIYGSVARDTVRADSDIDILVDFPEPLQSAAWRYAEYACGRRDVPHDIMPLSWCSETFRARVEPKALVLE